jgi:hypothetical protein
MLRSRRLRDRRLVLLRLAAVLLLAVGVSCGRPAPAGAEGEALEAALAADFEGQTALAEGDAETAARAFRRAAGAASRVPSLATLRWTALYNVACSEARRGDAPAALAALAESLAGGLDGRTVVVAGREVAAPDAALTLEHVLADPDLDALRGTAGFDEVMKPYVAAGEAHVVEVGDGGTSRRPAVLVLRGEDEKTSFEAVSYAWSREAGAAPWIVAALAGPVRRGDLRPRWLLLDGDERWAVARVGEVLDRLRADPRVDPERVFVAGAGPGAATAAWAAALAFPDRVAGVAAFAPRRLPAAEADALAAAVRRRASAPWAVIVGSGDEDLAADLVRLGITPIRASERASLPAVALTAWARGDGDHFFTFPQPSPAVPKVREEK